MHLGVTVTLVDAEQSQRHSGRPTEKAHDWPKNGLEDREWPCDEARYGLRRADREDLWRLLAEDDMERGDHKERDANPDCMADRQCCRFGNRQVAEDAGEQRLDRRIKQRGNRCLTDPAQ